MGNKQSHKCFVPSCLNKYSGRNSTGKLFFPVPNNEKRMEWIEAIGKTHSLYAGSSNTEYYCCEDHFDLSNDTEIIDGIKCLKQGVVPHLLIQKDVVETVTSSSSTSSSSSDE